MSGETWNRKGGHLPAFMNLKFESQWRGDAQIDHWKYCQVFSLYCTLMIGGTAGVAPSSFSLDSDLISKPRNVALVALSS